MTFLYVGNGATRDVTAFQLDAESGALAPVGTFSIPGTTEFLHSTPLAVTPDRRILFVGIRCQPWAVASFRIDPSSGRLEYLGSGQLADNTCYLSTDQHGRFLLSASYSGDKIAVNAIGPDGVALAPRQIIETGEKSHSIIVDGTNRHALSACLGGDVIYQWLFDGDSGRLAPNDPPYVSVKKHSGPRHLVFHPDGDAVYLLNEYTATIHVYDYDIGQGTLAEKQVVDALTPDRADRVWASDIHITPSGRFLYAAERGSSRLAILRVDPGDRTVSLVGHVVTEERPRGFAIDPTGRLLYCTGQLSGRLSRYAIDEENGMLIKLDDYRVGGNPNWVEIVCSP